MLKRRDAALLTIVGLLPFALSACTHADSSEDPRTQSPLVRVATVEAAVQTDRSFTGIVAARVQSDLGFRVSGKVLERLVDTGQAVKRGQPLMRMDPTDLRLAARAQDQAVAAATARARQTADDEARYRALVSAGAVSRSAYDQVRAAAESARAELDAARARADVARNETSYAVLLADADGVVVETLAEPGQVVAAGQVVIRVAHAGQREAVIDLPETLAPADRIDRPGDVVWDRSDGPCDASPVVGRRESSVADVRGTVCTGGRSGRRAARLDRLDPNRGPGFRADSRAPDRRDLRCGQGSRCMACRRRNASGQLACRRSRRTRRRNGRGRWTARAGGSYRRARRASAARRRIRATR